MRQRLVLGAPLACFALLAFGAIGSLGACGGSSSETPPPLQPDPKGFRYATSVPVNPASASADNDAGALPSPNYPDAEEKPRGPARSTWGSPKSGH